MNRLLTLVDDGDDDIGVRITCRNDETWEEEIGHYDYYFNSIQREDVGKRICPAADYDTFNKRGPSYDNTEWRDLCALEREILP